MATLRVAFLSALVLELAAAVATALVAVEVGLRLLYGHIGYETALLVLLLTPEAFLPLRAVGSQFHASMEGAAAAGRVFEILDTPVPDGPTGQPAEAARRPAAAPTVAADLRFAEIRLDGITAAYPGRSQPALDGVSLTVAPGERIVLTGPSGAGKSTLLALLLRFLAPAAGVIAAGGVDVAATDLEQWRRQIAWVPQQPYLFSGSAADNIALGQPGASRAGHQPGRRAGWCGRVHRCAAVAATTHRSGSAACGCRPVSASGSRWPARSCATLPCCCSTSPPRIWIRLGPG